MAVILPRVSALEDPMFHLAYGRAILSVSAGAVLALALCLPVNAGEAASGAAAVVAENVAASTASGSDASNVATAARLAPGHLCKS